MKSGRGFGLIEIIIVTAITLFIAYKVFNSYLNKGLVDENTKAMAISAGIDTTNRTTIVNSTRNRLDDIQKQRMEDLGLGD